MYRECFLVARESMTSVFELSAISNLQEMAYQHFMNYENEVLYLLNKGKLSGILSIGDLKRFFKRHESELKINRSYTSIRTVDYDMATAFFDGSVTINEIPVVAVQGDLLGIIRKEKSTGSSETPEADAQSCQNRGMCLARGGNKAFCK